MSVNAAIKISCKKNYIALIKMTFILWSRKFVQFFNCKTKIQDWPFKIRMQASQNVRQQESS